MPLHPRPGDLTQRKAAREQSVGVGTTIPCPLHHRGVPSSVCLSDSSGAIALGVLQPHDQFILVLQQELLAGFKGGAEAGGQSRHIGGDVIEIHWCSLVVVSHL